MLLFIRSISIYSLVNINFIFCAMKMHFNMDISTILRYGNKKQQQQQLIFHTQPPPHPPLFQTTYHLPHG